MNRRDILNLANQLCREYSYLYHRGSGKVLQRKSLDILADKYKLSKRTISRYIRLCYLIDGFKEGFLSGQISLKACVELSYLDILQQMSVCKQIPFEHITERLARVIRHKYENTELEPVLNSYIMSTGTNKHYGLPNCNDLYEKYELYKYTDEEVKEVLDKALNMWFSSHI